MTTVKFTQTTQTGERTLTRTYQIQVGARPFAWAGDATHAADVLYAPGDAAHAADVLCDLVERLDVVREVGDLRRAGQLDENEIMSK